MMCQADGADAKHVKLGLPIFHFAHGSTAMKESFLRVLPLISSLD